MPNVLVIDASASVRETLRIVLGHEHGVTVVPSIADVPRGFVPDVVVLGDRDGASVARAFSGILAGVPVLFLHAARDVDARRLVPSDAAIDFLPKPFDAYAVRARVRGLLVRRPSPAADDVRRGDERGWLEPPFLASATAEVARRVLASGLDVVLVQGEAGTGVSEVARALHVSARRGTFVAIDASSVTPRAFRDALAEMPSVGATLHVANVDRASGELQQEIAALVGRIRNGGRKLRVIAGTARDLLAFAADGGFLLELAYALTVAPIVLAPLRERSDDVPALVESLTDAWAPRLGLGPVAYRPATLERLRHYLWFGNVAEVEAVVMRTLVLRRPAVVEPEDLVFLPEDVGRFVAPDAGDTAPSVVVASLESRAPVRAAALAGLDLEVVLGELAHELRNPMVTIKTVAQHLDAILGDPEARTRFSELMTEAVGRMDGVVEMLLDFARFRDPVRRALDVGAVLDRVLDEQREDLARRQVHVEREGGRSGAVAVDEAQMLFALRSLCRGLIASIVPRSTLVVRDVESGVLEMCFRADPSVAMRLTSWVEPAPPGSDEAPPLAWALAAALLERNGAALTMRPGAEGSTVLRVEWSRRTQSAGVVAAERVEG